MVPIGLVMTVGKYVLVGLIYLFVLVVFRTLLREMGHVPAAPPTVAPAPVSVRPTVPVRRPTLGGQEPSATAAAAPVAPLPVAAAPVAPAIQAAPALVVEAAPEGGLATGMSFPLTAAVTIGRAAQNAIALHDQYASSHHAIIFLQEGKRILRDRGSTNGTLHNGQRLEGDVELRVGDRVTIGTTVFRFTG
jgi:hypothetical protein